MTNVSKWIAPKEPARALDSREALLTQASQRVHAVDVHSAAAANTLSATPAESQGWVQLVLDPYQGVEHHGPRLVQVESIGLHARLLGGCVWVPPVDLEGLQSRLLGSGFAGRMRVLEALGLGDCSHRSHEVSRRWSERWP